MPCLTSPERGGWPLRRGVGPRDRLLAERHPAVDPGALVLLARSIVPRWPHLSVRRLCLAVHRRSPVFLSTPVQLVQKPFGTSSGLVRRPLVPWFRRPTHPRDDGTPSPTGAPWHLRPILPQATPSPGTS